MSKLPTPSALEITKWWTCCAYIWCPVACLIYITTWAGCVEMTLGNDWFAEGPLTFFHYGISPHCAKNSWGRRLSPKVKAMHGKGSCWDEQRLATTGFWTVSVGQFYPLLPPPQLALSASSSKTYTLLHVGNNSTNSFTDHKFSNKQIKVWNIKDGIINLILLTVSHPLKSF